jgi:hypothetical protein
MKEVVLVSSALRSRYSEETNPALISVTYDKGMLLYTAGKKVDPKDTHGLETTDDDDLLRSYLRSFEHTEDVEKELREWKEAAPAVFEIGRREENFEGKEISENPQWSKIFSGLIKKPIESVTVGKVDDLTFVTYDLGVGLSPDEAISLRNAYLKSMRNIEFLGLIVDGVAIFEHPKRTEKIFKYKPLFRTIKFYKTSEDLTSINLIVPTTNNGVNSLKEFEEMIYASI